MPVDGDNSISQKIADQSPRKTARMAGLFYLIFILTTALAAVVRSRLIVSGDAAATANNIVFSGAIPGRFCNRASICRVFSFSGMGFIRVIKTG
jgi:hypothetical protein